ncbi:phosphatase PAP2 family protein [Hymenobacter sp. BT770]|uniref:phosphatase PAP2 family protein n=1 Tax=Hymenobacter sp. BT770 TaxID=2886942 RepID=UPI001D0F9B2B|nr:phosphatase PAP2 family protein [Hymenobacter sp. BT770]MCC3154376.1 phosphatase PAP2 family protein [Hymenobacter sp. BT770]MDO3415697.1 phosphatase PAP2 family protein [Hymenobacter sp. BT770]
MRAIADLFRIERESARWLRKRGPTVALFGLGWALPWLACIDLAGDIWEQEGFAPDQKLLAWLQAHRRPALDEAAVLLSRLGGTAGMGSFSLGLIGGLLLARRRWQAGLVGAGLGGAWLLQLAGKALLHRRRPEEWRPLVAEPAIPATVYSFPSGHAMAAAALAATGVLLLWPSRWRWPALGLGTGWAGTVGVARVYLGAHYPSDVLAGWLGSVGWVVGLYLLYFHPRRKVARPARFALR